MTREQIVEMIIKREDADMRFIFSGLLPTSPALSVLLEKLLDSESRAFLEKLASAQSTAGVPPDFIAKLYRLLQQPDERVKCLRLLCKHEDFGEEELQVLLAHLRVTNPSAFGRPQTASENDAESFAAMDRPNKLQSLDSATGQGGQQMSVGWCVRLISAIVHKKVKEDTLADQRGKAHVRFQKHVRDYTKRQYGTAALAEGHLRDLVQSVQQYAVGDNPLQARFLLFGEMVGVIDGSREWADEKTDFYLGFTARLHSLDQAIPPSVAAARRAAATTTKERRESTYQGAGSECLYKSVAMPANLRELLNKEEKIMVKVGSLQQLLELFVTSEATRKGLMTAIEQVAGVASNQAARAASVAKSNKVVDLDEVMAYIIMPAWQEAEDERIRQLTKELDTMFGTAVLNDQGLLDFPMLRQLSDASDQPLGLDALTNFFERAKLMTGEERSEDANAISKQAFIAVAIERSLFISNGQTAETRAFVLPRMLVGPPVPEETMPSAMKAALALKSSGPTSIRLKKRQSSVYQGGGMRSMVQAFTVSSENLVANKSDEPKDALVRVQKSDNVSNILKGALRQHFLFKRLSGKLLDDIVGYMSEMTVREGDVVIKEGTHGDYFYVAESGGFEVHVQGRCVHVYDVSKSEGKHPSFGELALMYEKLRAASIVATHDGVLWKLSRAGFRLASEQSTAIDPLMVLRKVPFFGSLEYDELQRLRHQMREIDFDPGEVVFSQGETGNGMYVIVKGEVDISVRDEAQSIEKILTTLKENTYFGERALLRNEPRSASITAKDQVKTLFISRQEFEAALGPLQALLDQDRRKREHAVLKKQKELETMGLADVSRGSFRFESPVKILPCGALYLATHLSSSEPYSLRHEFKQALVGASEVERVKREVEYLRELYELSAEVPFLPTLLRAFETDDSVYMLYKNKSVCMLDQLLFVGGIAEDALRFVGACVISALESLQSTLHALYRNIMPDNISLMDNGYVCLMDFRFCKRDEGACRTLCGSPLYFAPEMVRGEAQTAACDLWAIGVLMYELAEGEPPWSTLGSDDMAVLKRIATHTRGSVRLPEGPVRSALPSADHLDHLIVQLLDPEPHIRSQNEAALLAGKRGARRGSMVEGVDRKSDMTVAKELFAHSFFASVNWSKLADGDIVSPLQEYAQEQLSVRMEDVDWEEPDIPEWDGHEDFFGSAPSHSRARRNSFQGHAA